MFNIQYPFFGRKFKINTKLCIGKINEKISSFRNSNQISVSVDVTSHAYRRRDTEILNFSLFLLGGYFVNLANFIEFLFVFNHLLLSISTS